MEAVCLQKKASLGTRKPSKRKRSIGHRNRPVWSRREKTSLFSSDPLFNASQCFIVLLLNFGFAVAPLLLITTDYRLKLVDMIRICTAVCLILCLAAAAYLEAPYASWAHSHVVWINGKQQNQAEVIKMVDDYLARKPILTQETFRLEEHWSILPGRQVLTISFGT